jgi:hypothetical protein
MNRIVKGFLITLIAVFALSAIAMPAAARTVSEGGTIFEYEQGLDLSPFVSNGDSLARFQDDDPTKMQVYSINVGDATNCDLTMFDLGGNYGTYYVMHNSAPNGRLFIREPWMRLDTVLDVSRAESIAGKTVSRNNKIAFVIDAPEVGTYLPGTTMKIEITTPSGSKITQIADLNLAGIALNSARTYITGVDISGLEDGRYTAQACWQSPSGFANYASDSNSISFSVATIETGIVSNKAHVIKSNPFVVAVTGDSKTRYNLYIIDAATTPSGYPTITPGQPGIMSMNGEFSSAVDPAADTLANNERARAGVNSVAGTAAVVTTDASGRRVIEFATNGSTTEGTYTIKVVDTNDASRYDSVQVTVERGEVTVTAEGTGSYYFGEEIKFSGTNTDSDRVYLFLVAPNLGTGNGVRLDDVTTDTRSNDPTTFVVGAVKADDTWTYTWNTGDIRGAVLCEGTYTIYAVSTPQAKSDLADAEYATISVNLRKGFITAATNVNTLAKGDVLKITGTTEGKPDNVYVWIFGTNFYGKNAANPRDFQSVEDDGTFTYRLDNTGNLASGQYFVILQHPMTKVGYGYDVMANNTHMFAPGQSPVNLRALQASDAAKAVIDAIDSSDVDDTYTNLTFTVEEAWIGIDEIGNHPIGDRVAITGTTNLAEGNILTVDVTASTSVPTNASVTTNISGVSGLATVVRGEDGTNRWSYLVDTTRFAPDLYTVLVQSADLDMQENATFTLTGSVPCTLGFQPGNSTVAAGGIGTIPLVLDQAPQGLSGFEITVGLTNTSVAEIVGVELPSWAGLSKTGSLPADTLVIRAADLNNMVRPGEHAVTLCTLTIRGDVQGYTGITITPKTIESDVGSRYDAVTQDALLEVVAIHPFPRPDGGFYPTPADPNGDGMYEDLDGNGWIGFNDVVLYFNNLESVEKGQPCSAFDYDMSGFIGFNDVVRLFRMI